MTGQDRLRRNVVAVLWNGTIVGTGFFIDNDGSVLTCFHVVSDPGTENITDQPLSIRFNRADYPVECIFLSSNPKIRDVAVLQLTTRKLPDDAILLPLGNWDPTPDKSRKVYSYGYKLTEMFNGAYA